MADGFFENPILNSPYEEPDRHHALDDKGQPLNLPPVDGRRRSELISPVPAAKKQSKNAKQEDLFSQEDEEGQAYTLQNINEIRTHVSNWRRLPNPQDWGVSPVTQRLLQFWRHHNFQTVRPFFCQLEAVETAIWLTEVAPRQKQHASLWRNIEQANKSANPDLVRMALKLATGAGKTTVMAMLIAWQTLNAVRAPNSDRFSRAFLIVAPGITIRDRLQILLPSHPDNYYAQRELVPQDLLADMGKAKVVLTNYHVFKRKETMELSKVGRAFLQGRGEPVQTLETEGAMLKRACGELLGFKNVVVINDEAHHCYLRDRLTVMRELLHETGSVFVQIGDENVHRVRAVMDEVFGENNFVSQVIIRKTTGKGSSHLDNTYDAVVWYARSKDSLKYRPLYFRRDVESDPNFRMQLDDTGRLVPSRGQTGERVARLNPITSQSASATTVFTYSFEGRDFKPGSGGWKTNERGMQRLAKAQRLAFSGRTLGFARPFDDFPYQTFSDIWDDTRQSGFAESKVYVVQTGTQIIERCLLMASDPGDLVLDPTCGSGTTAYVAEQCGRRWITIDTSRVALALARTRLMSARYPYYLIADSPEGRRKEQEISGAAQPMSAVQGDIRQGFVCERAPRIQLRDIARNAEIDVIWEQWQVKLEPLREALNRQTGRGYEEWEIPREVQVGWDDQAITLHRDWWDARIARQKEIDASIAKRADVELLYDRPYEDKSKVRVAGPFTVESLSPHRLVPSDADAAWDEVQASEGKRRRNLASAPPADFAQIVLENLKTSGVQQGAKADRIEFTSLTPWPGEYIAAEGRFLEGPEGEQVERRAAIFIGPEFGTTSRPDLTAAAREATDARFDVLIAAAFNFEAHASELNRLGPLPILRAKINPDLHMAGELKNTGKGNLFIVFGEPDVEIETVADDQLQVKVLGVDVFDPNTGDIRSGDTKSIAAWFIDTDYDEESFFVRHAYFLGANDPYKSLKTALKAEIDEIAWSTLYRDVSRPFDRPSNGRIAVKVINHFGDEVMKVFRV